jgi:hypothetical protein
MKSFKITYCYGGPYMGAIIRQQLVLSDSITNAMILFHSLYKSEDIYSITEI